MKVTNHEAHAPWFRHLANRTLGFGLLAGCLMTACSLAQDSVTYSAAHAHSHNDYEQSEPFRLAHEAGFGSIEVDLFLREGGLFVAHDAADIRPERTLEALYLEPLANSAQDTPLQLLIDLKTGADSTLPVLVDALTRYPKLLDGSGTAVKIRVVVSGNRPSLEDWPDWPDFIYFDGRPGEDYTPEALARVGLISDNFRNYSSWPGGEQPLAESERSALQKVVDEAHALGKPVRFWAIPDNPSGWKLMTELGVDFINTDRIAELAAWLENYVP